jgi:hypothetical protein
MKKFFLLSLLTLAVGLLTLFHSQSTSNKTISGAPPYDASGSDFVSEKEEEQLFTDWHRPDGPAKVALQVGHWKNGEVPEELHRLRGNTGAEGGGKIEWEVNYDIAMRTKTLLEEKGITVEILPATVPPQYWADVFIAIHADSSLDKEKTGYKASGSYRDATGNADELVTSIEKEYQKATGLTKDDNITRNMRGYYAFSWWRYEHAIHPMTTAAILELGFMTNASDLDLLLNSPDKSAQGLANGIINYLKSQHLPTT